MVVRDVRTSSSEAIDSLLRNLEPMPQAETKQESAVEALSQPDTGREQRLSSQFTRSRFSVGSSMVQSQLAAMLTQKLEQRSGFSNEQVAAFINSISNAARRADLPKQQQAERSLVEVRQLFESGTGQAKAEVGKVLSRVSEVIEKPAADINNILDTFAQTTQLLKEMSVSANGTPSELGAKERLAEIGFAQTTIKKLSDSAANRLVGLDEATLKEVSKQNTTVEQAFGEKIESLPQETYDKLRSLPASEQSRIGKLSRDEMISQLNSPIPVPPTSDDAAAAKAKLSEIGFAQTTIRKLSDNAAVRVSSLNTDLLKGIAKQNMSIEQAFAAKIEALPEPVYQKLKSLSAQEQARVAKLTGEEIVAELDKTAPDTGVKIHAMPNASPEPLLDAINKAKENIDLSVYLFTSPTITDALKAAAARGVKVRVMLEPEVVGIKDANVAKTEELRAAGIEVKDTPPEFSQGNKVDHAKFMVVDKKELLFGTGNLVKGGLGEVKPGTPENEINGRRFNRDFWVTDTRSTAVGEAQKLFDADWNRETTSGTNFKYLVVTPDNASQKLFDLIDGAKDRLYVYNQSLSDATVIDKLIAAKQRGVDVKVIVNDPRSADDKNVAARQKLETAGIEVGYYRKYTLHAKAIVADNKSFIGSQNFTNGGLYNNREFGEIFEDPATTKQLADIFVEDFKTTGVVTGDKTQALETVQIHRMPESTNYPIVAAINSATKSVDLEVYILTDPGVTDALKLAAKRGVQVRVMLEPKPIGESSSNEAKATELREAGIDVKETPPEFNSNSNVDHAKFMVIDGRDLLFGTGNLVKSGLGESLKDEWNNRDFWVQDTRSSAVKEAALLFERDWNRQSTSDIDFKHLVVTPDNSNSRITTLIDNAKDRLYVYNQTVTDPNIVERIIAAKERGVDVRVLLGKPKDNDPNKTAFDRFTAAGIQVNYLTRNYLHAKGIVSDNSAFIGSQNFTGGGLIRNREVGQIFNDANIANQLVTTFLYDEANPAPRQ